MKNREAASKRHTSMKRFGSRTIAVQVCLSASLTLWPWEQDKSLRWIWVRYMNSRCFVLSRTVENSFSHGHPASTNEKCGLKRKTWGREAFVQGTAANLNSATAKTITSVSWKMGDNLFTLSNLNLLPHVDILISTTWSAGFVELLLHYFCFFPRSYTFRINATYWAFGQHKHPRLVPEHIVTPHVSGCASGICLCVCGPFPCASPICSTLVVAAHCQRADVWLLFLQQEFVWNP